MFEFLMRLFRGEPSGAKAKERLRLVLLSDHLALAPDVVESLKTDLLAVISRYVEVDIDHVDVTFEQREHDVAMTANVPILSMRTPHERPRPLAAASPAARNGAAPGPTAASSAEVAPMEPVETPAQTSLPAEAVTAEAPVLDVPSEASHQAAPEAGDTGAAGSRPADVIALPLPSGEGVAAKAPRARRRRRRKAALNGTQAQQSKTGAMTQPHL